MELVIEKKAFKALRVLPPKVSGAIVGAIVGAVVGALEAIAAEPFAQHRNVDKLRGIRDGFRLRHGDWRILYRVERRANVVRVEAVRPRGEAYKV